MSAWDWLGNLMVLPLFNRGVIYLLRDEFRTPLAAGSVNGTLAEPTEQTRTVADAETKLSITGGRAVVAGGKASPAFGDPGLVYPSRNRAAGEVLSILFNGNNTNYRPGWFSNATTLYDGYDIQTSQVRVLHGANVLAGFPVLTINTDYHAIIARRASAGAFFLIEGGDYTYPELVYISNQGGLSGLLPGMINLNGIFNFDEPSIPDQAWLPTPLASDGFSAATTDGLGHPETTGLGSGGAGKTWVGGLGTWGNSAGVRAASALDTGVAIDTINLSTADISHEAALTRSAGNVGIVVRYVDSANYVYAYHDGTNVTLRKVVAGTDSEAIAPVASTYAAGRVLRIICKGTRFDLFYNHLRIGAATISDAALQSGTKVGLYTTDTGNTFDNLVTYAKGTGGEYVALLPFFNPTVLTVGVSLWGMGDSAMLPTANMQTIVSAAIADTGQYAWHMRPNWSNSGYTVAQSLTYAQANLAAVTETPTIILIELGRNDAIAMPAEAQYKADFNALMDACVTKWPAVQFGIEHPWRRSYGTECNTLAGWNADIIAGRSDVIAVIDARVFIENGDDGITYTDDGTHPNAAGLALTATEWATALGY